MRYFNRKTILLSVLTGLNLVLLFQVYIFNRQTGKNTLSTDQEQQPARYDYAPLYELIQYSHISSGLQVNGDAILRKWDGDSCSMNELLGERPKVIFNFRYYNCRTCLDEELERLRSLKIKIGQENLVLISAFEDPRSHRAFEKEHNFEVFDIGMQKLGLPADVSGLPYIMVLDKTLLARNLYFTAAEFSELTDSFYNIITEKYFR